MAFPTFLLASNLDPVTRITFAVDEATDLEVASGDAGRPATRIAEVHYQSPGVAGQAWKCVPALDDTYGRMEGSLTSNTGPWTDLATGLADPSSADTAKTLWVRYVGHRWETTANPDQGFTLGLYSDQTGNLDEA